MITNAHSGTRVDEIADLVYRIHTPIRFPDGSGFSMNQYLVVDDAPLLFHTGPRKLFAYVREAMARVMPVTRLRYLSFSHVEADECGALNEWLAVAPQSIPVCGRVAAMTSIEDLADRAPRALGDGELLELGSRNLRWLDAPHLPHGWDCGYLFDSRSRTLLCGDLFTQPGSGSVPLTESDVLGPSEGFRQAFDYYAHAADTHTLIDKLAATHPQTLACMHGSAWQGDGAVLLRALGDALARR